jgi:CheY-like chemotaxis protein
MAMPQQQLASTPFPSLVQPRVLLSDDHAGTRAAVARRLEAAGLSVTLARDGTMLLENLVRALSQRCVCLPHLLIADVHMDGFNGMDALDLLRHAHWNTPVILIGAHAQDRPAPAQVPVFTAPLDVDALLAEVARQLPNAHA